MSTFTVVRATGEVVLRTDDWVDACTAALNENWPRSVGGSVPLYVRGTHPTHDWDEQRPRRCRACNAWDNGSYGSQAPCGYDWQHDSLMSALERERNAR